MNVSQSISIFLKGYKVRNRIVGNFGEAFNLANWRFYGKSPNFKSVILNSEVI